MMHQEKQVKNSTLNIKKKNKQHVDVIVVGGGAAGLFCALTAAKKGLSVVVLEQSKRIANKIRISGGGRCNFTNKGTKSENYLSNNPHFCKSALSRFSAEDFISFLSSYELTYHEKKLGQLFCDQKSEAIINALIVEAEKWGVNILCNHKVNDIKGDDHNYTVLCEYNSNFTTSNVIIATGGPSFPKLGGSDFALRIAKRYYIKNKPFVPALVPVLLANELTNKTKELSGLSAKVNITCEKINFCDDLLFTHKGLSGPAVLQISSYWNKNKTIIIDFLPDINISEWMDSVKINQAKQQVSTLLSKLLASRLVSFLIDEELLAKKIQQINHSEWKKIIDKLTHWEITPIGTEGMKKAEVCTGGISTDELSSKTFESKKHSGLYFIGEAIDVTGWLGGYNFQWAWASAWCCGQALKNH